MSSSVFLGLRGGNVGNQRTGSCYEGGSFEIAFPPSISTAA